MSDLPQRPREYRGEGSGASRDRVGGRGAAAGSVAFHGEAEDARKIFGDGGPAVVLLE